jgi:L-rhamnose-H+ transport protein
VFAYLCGMMWGLGSLTFGLTMRYLGMGLGMSIALGFCTVFGTLIPPIYAGDIETLFLTAHGLVMLIGVAVCVAGIATCGYAGMLKEKEMTEAEKRAAVKEFALTKGLLIAVFSGIMSAGFAFGISAGKPVAETALGLGAAAIFKNSPVFILVMGGGFTINLIWCSILTVKNKSFTDFYRGDISLLFGNYSFAIIAGVMWYTGFFFYGMGTTKMGDYDFVSWSIHMASVIFFSNLCGLLAKEWKGARRKVFVVLTVGLVILVLSTAVIGMGNYLATR